MQTDSLDFTRRQERILNRRAARARRSKWLGRMLFSLTGMGLVVPLRMNPALISDVMASPNASARGQPPVIGAPHDVLVRIMPSDAVPVRRGNSVTGRSTTRPPRHTQSQAQQVEARLQSLRPGG